MHLLQMKLGSGANAKIRAASWRVRQRCWDGVGSGSGRGRAEGVPVRSGSQFDQRAQERMTRRNEMASTNDNRMIAGKRRAVSGDGCEVQAGTAHS